MTEDIEQLKNKIVESGSLTKDQVEDKLKEKLSSLGGLISEEGALHIIANENGIKLGKSPSSELKLKDVLTGMRNVTVVAKVLRKYEPRTFGQNNDGKVASLFMGDDTGFMRLTFWNDKVENIFNKISENDVLEVQHAYSRENNGYVELHMGNSSNCIINPEGKTVTVKERSSTSQDTPEKKLKDVTENDDRLAVTATIVQAYDPRFFESCPECGKRLQTEGEKYVCRQHGEQEPTYNYVMNIFLDDGTDNMRGTVWKRQVNQLLAMEEEAVIKLKDDKDRLEEVKTDLLGTIIKAKGRVKKNTVYNNLELVLFEIDVNPDPNKIAAEESKQQASTDKTDTSSQTRSSPEEKQESTTQKTESTAKKQSDNSLSEESLADDDDLPSIDDIDEDY
ncbi:MAG: OB-fold nucleic acid binding domain-containing protein [Candidatus Woesearchaeota archaeon]